MLLEKSLICVTECNITDISMSSLLSLGVNKINIINDNLINILETYHNKKHDYFIYSNCYIWFIKNNINE